jgi:hypothetical protein
LECGTFFPREKDSKGRDAANETSLVASFARCSVWFKVDRPGVILLALQDPLKKNNSTALHDMEVSKLTRLPMILVM